MTVIIQTTAAIAGIIFLYALSRRLKAYLKQLF